ncbi:RNA methyltransferase [bacterium]|nr:RNA methyltransferase [bacterium]
MKITSVNNDLVKETAKLLQRKYRDESGLFLLEGDKCIEEALSSGIEIERVFTVEGYKSFGSIENIETTEAVLKKISSTESAPKAVAVAKQIKIDWDNSYKKVILLENIKDAGNLGTILRTSAAFGVDAIILYGDTVDLYNPKCVRSSVGNLWKVPVLEINDYNHLKRIFEKFERIATLPKSKNTVWLKDYMPAEKVLIMFGSEATGLSEELKDFATKNVTIEMSQSVESLNLSISAGIFLYTITR